MDDEEREKLDAIHDDLREAVVKVEVMDERTQRIDSRSNRLEQRVFGPDGLDEQIQRNTTAISRLHGISAAFAALSGTVAARVLELFP